MSTIPRARNRTPSPNRARPSKSKTISPSHERKPLHERSESQRNASPGRSTTSSDAKVYNADPFPRLPSQMFSPRSGPFVFEDKVSAVGQPRKERGSRRRNPELATENIQTEEDKQRPALAAKLKPTKPREEVRPTSSRTFGDIFEAGGGSTKRKQPSILKKPAPYAEQPKLEPSPSTDTFAGRRRRQKTKSRERNTLSQESLISPPQHKSLERIRSQSSVGSRKARVRRDPSPETPRSKGTRPRSASSPETPTEAFIQTLIRDPTNLQYPTIRQPSVTSLRSQSSASRVAYPAPLRLQRKRASSHLGQTASDRAIAANGKVSRVRHAPSQVSVLSRSTMADEEFDFENQPLPIDLGRISGNWADELVDVVPELDSHQLRQQRFDYRDSSESGRPTTRDSFWSGRGSFYHFLNDSKTAWANVYYRNESRIRLETPPRVTQLQSPWVFSEELTPRPTGRSASNAQSQSQSPASAEFPDTIYIRRYRPHSYQPYRIPSASSLRRSSSLSTTRTIHHSANHSLNDTATFTSTTDGHGNPYAPTIPDPELAAFYRERLTNRNRNRTLSATDSNSITALPTARPQNRPITPRTPVTPPHNPTAPLPPIPHLSPDKRVGAALPRWVAPSLDSGTEDVTWFQAPFSPVNRQILLFAIGFVLPLSWWIAAILPLPVRPRLRTPEMRESGVDPDLRFGDVETGGTEARADLFDDKEVRRYQKARWWRVMNRFMSVVGGFVVVAVVCLASVFGFEWRFADRGTDYLRGHCDALTSPKDLPRLTPSASFGIEHDCRTRARLHREFLVISHLLRY